MPTKQDEREDQLNPANEMHSDERRNPVNRADAARRDLTNREFDSLTSPEHFSKNGVDPTENAAKTVDDSEGQIPFIRTGGRPKKMSLKGKMANFSKKKGPVAMLIALLLGGGTIFSIMLAPSLAVIHFKEILTDKLNDQLPAVNMRTQALLANKIDNSKATVGLCSSKVNIRCKFTTTSKKQIARFEKAGFIVEVDPDNKPFGGRERILRIQSPEIDGQRMTFNNPGEFSRAVKSNVTLASMAYRAYHPKSAALSNKFDRAVSRAFFKLGVSKAPVLTGNDRKGFATQLYEATRGHESKARLNTDGSTDDENQNKEKTDLEKELETDKKISIDEAKSRFKSGAGVLAGAQSACGIYSLMSFVEGAAKGIRALQLSQYAMALILTPADEAKAGNTNQDIMGYIGDKITQPDMRQTVPDPMAKDENTTMSNPAYGKSAMDAPFFKAIAYNDPMPNPPYRSSQFMVGGGLVGKMAQGRDEILGYFGDKSDEQIREGCGVVMHPVSIAISFLGMFTGVGTIIGLGSMALGIAFEQIVLPILLQQAANALAGEVVDADTANVDIGDAVTTGTATTLGTVAQQRGMVPMDISEFNNYLTYTQEDSQRMIAAEMEAAKETPFDVYNQYSFLGMFARSIAPSMVTAKTSAIAAMQTMPNLLGNALGSIGSTASANTQLHPDRANSCPDTGYKNIELDGDIGCIVRWGLPEDETSSDPGTAAKQIDDATVFMIENGHIDEEDMTGEAIEGSAYETWIKACPDRQQGLGVYLEEDFEEIDGVKDYDLQTGKACTDMQNPTIKQFRIFHFNNSLATGMEYEEVPKNFDSGAAEDFTGNLENSGNIRDDGWAWPGPAGTTACGFDCYGGHFGMDVNAPDRSDIYAAYDGRVIHAGVDQFMTAGLCPVGALNGPQQTIVITHTINGQKVDTYYTHLTVGSFKVKAGDTVKAGDLIGISGNTGCSTGPHLHFGIYQGGYPSPANAVDPTTILGRSG